MVVIRLNRVGSTHTPKYRVTVADSRRWRGGRFIEVIGTYNPNPQGQDKEINVDMERINYWVSKGAQPTDRVKRIMKKVAGA